jgi:hypothetical protein
MLEDLKMLIRFVFALLLFGIAAGCAQQEPATVTGVDAAGTGELPADTVKVSLEVPTMSCPFACWPHVKETLEGESGVTQVTLAPQKDANAIDNPVVYVAAGTDFNAEKAIADLAAAGFAGAKVKAE